MLTGKMVRVRYARDRVLPHYIDTSYEYWLETAERLLTLFREHPNATRGEIEDVGAGGVHGDVYVGARARGSPCLRAEEKSYAHVLAAREGLAQAGGDLVDRHRPSLPWMRRPVTVPS